MGHGHPHAGRPAFAGGMMALFAAVAFGVTTPFVQRLGAGVGSFVTAALLYLGATVGSLGSSSHEARVRRKHLPRLVLVAVFGAFAAPSLLAWGLQRSQAADASLLLNFEACFTVFFGWAFFRESIGRRVVIAVGLMVTASIVLVGNGHSSSAGLVGWGPAAILGATFFWSLDNSLTRPLSDLDAALVVRVKCALGAALALGLALTTGQPWPGREQTLGLLVCGAIGYGVSLRFYVHAQRRIGAGRTASLFATAPFVGAAVAWAVGEQSVTGTTLISGVLFALGSALHLTEKHSHGHFHAPLEHEHAHRHDDGHHDHRHEPPVLGTHSHVHVHDAREHSHPHSADLHHRHGHEHGFGDGNRDRDA